MKCVVKVSHKDIEKFKEIQRLRKELESFQKDSNKFEVIQTEMPIIDITISKRFPYYSIQHSKSLEQIKELTLKDMAVELSKYIIENNLWELKEYQDNNPSFNRLEATLKVATNKKGD